MSEITEFLVFRSALAATPAALWRLVPRPPGTGAGKILHRMITAERLALVQLQALLGGRTSLPASVPADTPEGDLLEAFSALREDLLHLLDSVDASTLHATGRLPSGRELDPWRLAGNLADHDVRCLASLRAERPGRGTEGG